MFSVVNLPQRTQLLLAGVLLYLVHYVFSIPENIQLFIFAAGILFTGIPHGAMDHLLYLKQHPNGKPIYKWLKFLSFYLGYALLYGMLWIINIELAILFFIGISAYHFGEMDLKNVFSRYGITEKIISTSYGLLFLLNYLLFRWPEVQGILLGFPGFSLGNTAFFGFLYQIRFYLLFSSILTVITTICIYYQIHRNSFLELTYQLIQLALLCLITYQLPILLGFGFYFNAWHAILSITEIKAALGWGQKSWFYALKKAWFTNLAAFLFIALMLIFFKGDLNRLVAILFMSIAILTAPHIQVISGMFKQQD